MGNQIPFSLLQSVLHSNGEDIFIECALVLVLKLTDKDMKNEKFETHIEWITLFSGRFFRISKVVLFSLSDFHEYFVSYHYLLFIMDYHIKLQ